MGEQVELVGELNDIGGLLGAAATPEDENLHRQVETSVVTAEVRMEVERHALASAFDGGDGGLGAIAGAAHSVEQFGAAGSAAVIDGQIVKVVIRRDVARQAERIARGGGQGESTIAIIAVVTTCTTVVIHLERCHAFRDSGRLGARLGHVDGEV